MIQILMRTYRLWQGLKHQVLLSVFGYSSHCKHTPTCSRYLEEQVESHGTIVGLWRGLSRVLRCW